MVKHSYMYLAFVGMYIFSCAQIYAKKQDVKKKHEVVQHKKNVSSISSPKSKKSKKNHISKHYLHPYERPKNNAPGAPLQGLKAKGNILVPMGMLDIPTQHHAMMHVYSISFHDKNGHITSVLKALHNSASKKVVQEINNVCKHQDDWKCLKNSIAAYMVLVHTQIKNFKNERNSKNKVHVDKHLQRTLKKIAHTQSILMYATQSLHHSRLLLEEYAENFRLMHHIKGLEKSLEDKNIRMKFNDVKKAQDVNRIGALVILLEGAVVHYGAALEAYTDSHEDFEKSLHDLEDAMQDLIQEIKAQVAQK